MEKIRFAVIGSGWRSEFYVRIAKAVPNLFELSAVLIRSKDKGEAFAFEHDIVVVDNYADLLKTSPSFVVLSIARGFQLAVLRQIFESGLPVLCETPPAESLDDLKVLWNLAKDCNAKIQVAEQYFLQPLYAAWGRALDLGLIGDVQNIHISSLHGYHGVSMIRKYLNLSKENCVIYGKRYYFEVIDTLGREGLVKNGERHKYPRDRLTLEFENGKIAFFDFSDPAQYHSLIRTRQLTVQGLRGEIDDLTVRYLTSEGIAVCQELNRVDFGLYNNQEFSHYGLYLGERELYVSPFFTSRLNDDEIAVATCLQKMAEYLSTGVDFYSLREALQDTYISLEMENALKNTNYDIKTTEQCWWEED